MRRHMRPIAGFVVALAAVACTGLAVTSAQAPAAQPLPSIKVQGNVYMVVGAGGNIALQIGEDGVVLVDTGAAENATRVIATIRSLTDKPIRYIINTSADADH